MINCRRLSYRDSFLFSIKRITEVLCRFFAGLTHICGHDSQLGGGSAQSLEHSRRKLLYQGLQASLISPRFFILPVLVLLLGLFHSTAIRAQATVTISSSEVSLEPGESATITFTLSATQSVATIVPLNWSGTAGSGRYATVGSITIPSGSRTVTFSLAHRDVSVVTSFGSVVVRITGTDNAQVQVGDPSSVSINLVSLGTPPDPPTDVRATPGNERVTLSWTKSSGVTNQDIYWTSAAESALADDALGVDSGSSRTKWLREIANFAGSSATVQDHDNGRTTRIRIRSKSPNGVSEWVIVKYITRGTTSSAPGIPAGLSITPADLNETS